MDLGDELIDVVELLCSRALDSSEESFEVEHLAGSAMELSLAVSLRLAQLENINSASSK